MSVAIAVIVVVVLLIVARSMRIANEWQRAVILRLGRYWRTATPEQQREYLGVFRQVLMNSVAGKIGDYQGVSYTIGRGAPRDDSVDVPTIVNRPGNAPNKVDWIVTLASGSPKIIDMIAEGVSLRLTQRSDYSAYLERNNNSVQALIDAMRQQIAQNG